MAFFFSSKYVFLNNSFESNNVFFKTSIQILKSLFEQNQKCGVDHFFSSMFQNNICLAKKETQIKADGLWKEYEDYKIYSNMIAYGTDILAQFRQALADCKQEYEMVNEDGTIEKWKMERDVDEMKAEISADIEKYEKEIVQITELRNEAYEKLKDKNYDLVRPIND
jgi:hypothetical protein